MTAAQPEGPTTTIDAEGHARCYRFDRFELQPGERRLLCYGEPWPLRPLAFDVLTTLVARAGRLVTKDELLRHVWQRVVVEENTVQAHVSALRKVLGADAIETVAGLGYRFTRGVQAVADPASPCALPPNNLPRWLTRFIGRTREMAELRQRLGDTRLLTLTGAAGCGKSRLALEAVHASLGNFPDGACLVQLAPLSDPEQLARALVAALAVQTGPEQDLTSALVEALRTKRLLLMLDNAERLIEATARLSDRLLRSCPMLVILATSRERIGVDGERCLHVPALSLPASDAEADVLGSEAVRLFIDRARLQKPDLRLWHGEGAAAASICRRLDGMALAIELAAAHVRAMSLQALGERLDDRFQWLAGGSRTELPHHRTLRSLIDWSYDLLTPMEQAVLRRASVFAEGWSLDQAEAVCAGAGVERREVVHLLTALVEKNLVSAETQGSGTRFGMTESIRYYALERLADSPEGVQLWQRQPAAQEAPDLATSGKLQTSVKLRQPA